MPQRFVISVCVTKCSRDQVERMSSGFTVTRSRKHSRLPKSLNLRHFPERGTLLAAIRAKELRTAQTPLRDPNEIDPRSILSLHEQR